MGLVVATFGAGTDCNDDTVVPYGASQTGDYATNTIVATSAASASGGTGGAGGQGGSENVGGGDAGAPTTSAGIGGGDAGPDGSGGAGGK